jgi:hypothetical protein
MKVRNGLIPILGVCNNIMNLVLNQQKFLPGKELSTSQGTPSTEVLMITLIEPVSV